MTTEHLRPLLENPQSLHSFFLMCEKLSKANVPPVVVEAIRVGRLTALRKPDGSARGIVAGDVIRRLVSRTIAQQIGKAVERATTPHQYALSTRARSECIAHVLQGLCEQNPQATVMSIDGLGAFDPISRAAMLDGLLNVAHCGAVLPFVWMSFLLSVGGQCRDGAHDQPRRRGRARRHMPKTRFRKSFKSERCCWRSMMTSTLRPRILHVSVPSMPCCKSISTLMQG